MKKVCLIMILALVLTLCACTGQKSAPNDQVSPSASAASGSPTDVAQSASAPAASSEDSQWPAEFSGKLPTPVCTITDVTRYDEKSMSGKLTIVNFSGMSKDNAEKYVKDLKSMGFSGGVENEGSDKIIFSGVGTDQKAKNGVNFLYNVSDGTGSISY